MGEQALETTTKDLSFRDASVDQLNSQIQDLHAALATCQREKETALNGGALNQARLDLAEKEGVIVTLRDVNKQELTTMSTKLEEANALCAEQAALLENATVNLDHYETKNAKLENEILKLNELATEAKTKAKMFQERESQATSIADSRLAKVTRLEVQLDQTRTTLDDLRERVTIAERAHKEALATANEARAHALAQVSLLSSQLDAQLREVADHKDQLKSTRSQLKSTRSQLDSALGEQERLTTQLDQAMDRAEAKKAEFHSQLQATQAILTATQDDLATAQANLSALKPKLSATQDDLATAQANLSALKPKLSATQAENADLTASLAASEAEVVTIRADLASAQATLFARTASFNHLKSELDSLRASSERI